MYSKEIQNLINEFSQFPGIGPKTAQRFVFYLLRKDSRGREKFIIDLKKLNNIFSCSVCGNFSDKKICFICQDKNRLTSKIIIVAEPQDLIAIERTGEYKGLYHILGGLIDTVRDFGPEKLKIGDLFKRLSSSQIKEVIFALNSTIEGESTVLYIVNKIKKDEILSQSIKVTKIARGLPLGAEIEYADEVTLGEALKDRKAI